MYDLKRFKDGQYSAAIKTEGDLICRIRGNSYDDLFKAATIKEAWDFHNRANPLAKSRLEIFCLIGQRSDRRFESNESFDLKVITNFINGMKFKEVAIFHPHSDVSNALIENCEKMSHHDYVKQAYLMEGQPTLISPDAGAYKQVYQIASDLGANLIPANKVRINGKPMIEIQGDVKGQNCLIVDDLLDGGRTFMSLAEKLKENGAEKVTLYISHGIFSQGIDTILDYVDHVYCTDSYQVIKHAAVTQFVVFGE